jgi:hypothetical protein
LKWGITFRVSSLIVLVFILPVGCNASLVSILPEFPIGLSLEYDRETVYWPSTTHFWVDTYDVIRWNATDNSCVIIDNGYLRNDPWEYNTFEVWLPSWNYEYFSDEENRTISSWMYPLWIDISNWAVGENISIPAMSENSQVYQVQSEESVEIGVRSIRCWVVRTDFVGANDWDYTYTLRYDIQYGILIKVNTVRNPGFDDIGNYATHEAILSSSNVMNLLYEPQPEPPPGPVQFPLTILLVLGIVFEVLVIVFIVGKRQTNSP